MTKTVRGTVITLMAAAALTTGATGATAQSRKPAAPPPGKANWLTDGGDPQRS
jgi:hypothetical protein